MKNNNGLLVGLLIGIIVTICLGACLFLSGTIKFNNSSTKNNQKLTTNNIDAEEVTFNNEKISIQNIIQESIHISSASIESINPNYDYYIELHLSGKVKIRTIGMSEQNSNDYWEEFISNVEDVVDIIQFTVPAEPDQQLIYLLQSNGDVYYYKVGDSRAKKFTATKVDNVSNVKQLFIYNYPIKENTGGSWSIVAIKDNNETVSLNTEGV